MSKHKSRSTEQTIWNDGAPATHPDKIDDATDLVSLNVVKDMIKGIKALSQQKAYYNEMMDKQSHNLTKIMKMFMESTNERLDGLNRQELKDSIQYTQGEVDETKSNTSKISADHNTLESGMRTICDVTCLTGI